MVWTSSVIGEQRGRLQPEHHDPEQQPAAPIAQKVPQCAQLGPAHQAPPAECRCRTRVSASAR